MLFYNVMSSENSGQYLAGFDVVNGDPRWVSDQRYAYPYNEKIVDSVMLNVNRSSCLFPVKIVTLIV